MSLSSRRLVYKTINGERYKMLVEYTYEDKTKIGEEVLESQFLDMNNPKDREEWENFFRSLANWNISGLAYSNVNLQARIAQLEAFIKSQGLNLPSEEELDKEEIKQQAELKYKSLKL